MPRPVRRALPPALLLAGTLVAWGLTLARADTPAAVRTTNPHGALRVDCGACHTAESFTKLLPKPAFRHDDTGFRLRGAHAQASCKGCHRSLDFARVASACVDCHRDPHRAALGFECARCHTPTTWNNQRDQQRAHDRTRFPLLGAHAAIDCTGCHRQQHAEFAGTPSDCVACHRPDYDATRNPAHARAGFSLQCRQCHDPGARSWQGVSATFPHPAAFPLTGAHVAVACSGCHANSRFAGTPRDCVACHRADYDRTRNPDHRSAGFPTSCAQCHTTAGWPGATFDHDARFFPIDSGAHRGVWPSCSTCHVSPGNFRVFECVQCHEHSRARMDDKHDDVRGYAYQSASCYSCHPRGQKR
jgi:hypothetical protein